MQVCSAHTVDTPASNMILPFNRDLAWVRDHPCGGTHTSFTDSSCLRDSSDEHAARNNLVKSREIFDFVSGILHKFRLHPAVPSSDHAVGSAFPIKSPSARAAYANSPLSEVSETGSRGIHLWICGYNLWTIWLIRGTNIKLLCVLYTNGRGPCRWSVLAPSAPGAD